MQILLELQKHHFELLILKLSGASVTVSPNGQVR